MTNNNYCEYYLGGGKCLIGECYITKMPLDTSKETINEHTKNCISKKVILKKYLNNKKLEKKLNKNL